MSISAVGTAVAAQVQHSVQPESAETPGAPDHDGDSDDSGAAGKTSSVPPRATFATYA